MTDAGEELRHADIRARLLAELPRVPFDCPVCGRRIVMVSPYTVVPDHEGGQSDLYMRVLHEPPTMQRLVLDWVVPHVQEKHPEIVDPEEFTRAAIFDPVSGWSMYVIEGIGELDLQDGGQACIVEVMHDDGVDDGIFVRVQSWIGGDDGNGHDIRRLAGRRLRVTVEVVPDVLLHAKQLPPPSGGEESPPTS